MEGAKSDTGKLAVQAARPTSGDVEGATIPSPARGAPLHDGVVADNNKALDEPAAAGDEVMDDDEQVERFYALLANIRAMRAVFRTTETAGKRKRLRGSSEPPWRPAFRMEDFEADATTAMSRRATRKTERSQPDGKEGKEDAAVVTSSPPRKGARRFDNNSKSI